MVSDTRSIPPSLLPLYRKPPSYTRPSYTSSYSSLTCPRQKLTSTAQLPDWTGCTHRTLRRRLQTAYSSRARTGRRHRHENPATQRRVSRLYVYCERCERCERCAIFCGHNTASRLSAHRLVATEATVWCQSETRTTSNHRRLPCRRIAHRQWRARPPPAERPAKVARATITCALHPVVTRVAAALYVDM